jgi:cytochrome c-type protein NapB
VDRRPRLAAPGSLFVPFFDERLLINELTLDAHDPISKQPDYKKCAVCLVCHDRGMAIAGKHAPPMSHDAKASCLQCHVVGSDPRIAAPVVAAPETSFAGLRRSGGGAQAWTGAPLVIPHPTWMRERCDSCHGPRGRQGLRTPHPGQQSCQQCHAPSAAFDQRNLGPGGATP